MVLTWFLLFYKIRIALEQIKCSKTKSYLGRRFLASRCPSKTKLKILKAKQKVMKRNALSKLKIDEAFLIVGLSY